MRSAPLPCREVQGHRALDALGRRCKCAPPPVTALPGRHRIDATTTARRCWSCTRSPVSRRRREPAKPAASQVRSDCCVRAKVPSTPWRPLAIRPRRARAAVCPLDCRGDTQVKATGAVACAHGGCRHREAMECLCIPGRVSVRGWDLLAARQGARMRGAGRPAPSPFLRPDTVAIAANPCLYITSAHRVFPRADLAC